jgi:hypothetical protein
MRATVTGGKARRMRTLVTRVVQTKSGSRRKVIPGARKLRIVTRKFSDPRMLDVPRKISANSQKSECGPTENGFVVSGA